MHGASQASPGFPKFTKCNTLLRCCQGFQYKQISIEERCEIARVPPDPRSGKSLQIWIARHRRSCSRAEEK